MFRLDRLGTWILVSAVIAAIVYTYLLSKTVKQQDEYIDELTDELSTTRAEIRALAYRINQVPVAAPAAPVAPVEPAPVHVPAKPALLVIHEEEPEAEEDPVVETVPPEEPVKTKSKTKKNA